MVWISLIEFILNTLFAFIVVYKLYDHFGKLRKENVSDTYYKTRGWLGGEVKVEGVPGVETCFKRPDGKPELFFHGTCGKIERFNFEYTNKGNDQLGSGFYFTSCPIEAGGFANDERRAGNAAPNVVAAFIKAKNPLPAERIQPLSEREVLCIVHAAPNLDEALSDWGDVDFEGVDVILRRAVEAYVGDDETPLLRTLFKLANDFYDDDIEAFNRTVEETLGYDCVVQEMEDRKHIAVWYPEQVVFPYCDNCLYPEIEETILERPTPRTGR